MFSPRRLRQFLAVGLLSSLIAHQSYSAQVPSNPLKPTKEILTEGRNTFYSMCVTCHGMDGKGQTDTARSLVTPPTDLTRGEYRYGGGDRELFRVIENGTASGMAAFGGSLDDEQIWQLVHYVRTFAPGRGDGIEIEAETVLENPIGYSMASISRGKQLYQRFCIQCHGENGKGDTAMREFLKTKPADLTDDKWTYGSKDGMLFKVIKEGTESDMESFADRLSDERIWHVVNYLRSLGPKD